MNKHTPGPWTHEGQGDITGIEDNGFGRGPVDVCSVYLRTVEGRHEANACLIAAAPDLLEAAQLALQIAESWIHDQLDGTSSIDGALLHLDPVRAAIARARGEA